MSDKLLTYEEACDYLGFKSFQGLRTFIDKGLPVIKIGGTCRISTKDLEAFLEAHKVVKTK